MKLQQKADRTKRKDSGTEEVLYRLGLAAALTAAAVCMFLPLVPPAAREWLKQYSFCVIYRFTGFTCPGCGGTRALTELFHGHIVRSVLYHPLVVYGVVFYLVFMGSHTWAKGVRWSRKRVRSRQPAGKGGRSAAAPAKQAPAKEPFTGLKWRDGYAIAAVVLLIGNFIIKNLLYLLTGMDALAELDCLSVG